MIEEKIPLRFGGAVAVHDGDRIEPGGSCRGCRGADVVRLGARSGDDDIGFLRDGVGDGILEPAYFVAAEAETRQVIALDKDPGTLESTR